MLETIYEALATKTTQEREETYIASLLLLVRAKSAR